MAPFASAYTNHELVDVVREVTAYANPRRPTAVSLRAFDLARADAGYPDAPRSSRICERLNMNWPELKELAHDPTRSVEQTLAVRLAADEPPCDSSLDQAIRCLRAVSRRLGGAPLTPERYDAEANAIRAGNQRRWRHGASVFVPTANQVERLAGSFRKGCELAGVPFAVGSTSVPNRWSWTDEELVDALVRLMDENPGVAVTQRSYRTLRNGRAEFPTASVFSNKTQGVRRPGLRHYRAEAERRRRARKRGRG